MVFRDISWFLALPPTTAIVLFVAALAALAITSFIMYVVVKVLQREAVFGTAAAGEFGFFRVFNVRIIFWVLFAFVGLLNVDLAQLAWMYIVAILVMLLTYEFVFDLGAVKTSAATIIDIMLMAVSFYVLMLVYQALGGAAFALPIYS